MRLMRDPSRSGAPWATQAAFLLILGLGAAVPLSLPGQSAGAEASPAPNLPLSRPAPPPPSSYLSGGEGKAFVAALDAVEKGNEWGAFLMARQQVNDPIASKVLDWIRFNAERSGASFAEITAFQTANPAWPRQDRLTQRAEEALFEFPVDDADVLAWFSGREPVTGPGKLRYGRALLAEGQKDQGAYWIQRAWIDHEFSRSREQEILNRHGALLPLAAHEDRLNRLLWEQRYTDARRMLQLVNENSRRLAEARISLMRRERHAESMLSKVPAHLRGDIGLLYEEARYRRRQGNRDQAIPLLLTAPAAPHTLDPAGTYWTERRIAFRNALEEGRFQNAYELARDHGHESGVAFAEGEFMAGWVALQYLNRAETAYGHFEKLYKGVSTPISLSRGAYWMGRAADTMGQTEKAKTHFREAASHSTTFYGQLAQSSLNAMGADTGKLALPAEPDAPRTGKPSLMANPVMKAMLMLYDADWPNTGRIFAQHLAETLTHKAEIAALAQQLTDMGYTEVSVRVAKVAAMRNIIIAEYAYPLGVVPAFQEKGRPVESALVYGLSRQESEFNPRAISHAGARGLMQLMPATAQGVARRTGVPYRKNALLDDPSYNAMLGTAHLGELLDEYDGSYIMTVAAYNAGAHRVKQWVETYGDPRSDAVDPIDWIESITFAETRNYVQRVMENVQIYRARMQGGSADLKIAEDLSRYQGAAFASPPPPRLATRTPLAPPSAQAPVPTAASPVPAAQPSAPEKPALQRPAKLPLASPRAESAVMAPIAEPEETPTSAPAAPVPAPNTLGTLTISGDGVQKPATQTTQ